MNVLDMGKDSLEQIDKYNETVQRAELRHVLLISSSFEMDPNYFEKAEEERSLQRGEDVKSFTLTEDGCGAAAEVEFYAKAAAEDEVLFSIVCKYVVYFSFDEPVEQETAQKVILRVGRFTAYPFFRQHVAQISWESGLDIPMLPIIKQTHEFKAAGDDLLNSPRD
jgi:hypothetical protein